MREKLENLYGLLGFECSKWVQKHLPMELSYRKEDHVELIPFPPLGLNIDQRHRFYLAKSLLSTKGSLLYMWLVYITTLRVVVFKPLSRKNSCTDRVLCHLDHWITPLDHFYVKIRDPMR